MHNTGSIEGIAVGVAVPNPLPVFVSWSSGKDAAWALHVLQKDPARYDVRGLFTTVNEPFDRVAIHGTPRRVALAQAERTGLPLYEVHIPSPCTNAAYESAHHDFLERMRALPAGAGATHLAFGDLFLEDVRRYRERLLAGSGFHPLFPLFGRDTSRLAEELLRAGLRAIVTTVNTDFLPGRFAGRWYDREFLDELPEGIDPMGENGEFHTCVVDGPMFHRPLGARPGQIVRRRIEVASDESAGIRHPEYVYADVVL